MSIEGPEKKSRKILESFSVENAFSKPLNNPKNVLEKYSKKQLEKVRRIFFVYSTRNSVEIFQRFLGNLPKMSKKKHAQESMIKLLVEVRNLWIIF